MWKEADKQGANSLITSEWGESHLIRGTGSNYWRACVCVCFSRISDVRYERKVHQPISRLDRASHSRSSDVGGIVTWHDTWPFRPRWELSMFGVGQKSELQTLFCPSSPQTYKLVASSFSPHPGGVWFNVCCFPFVSAVPSCYTKYASGSWWAFNSLMAWEIK